MKCYVCTKNGMSKDAVAVCALCGMALCVDHVVEREVSGATVSPWGVKSSMIILCGRCARASEETA